MEAITSVGSATDPITVGPGRKFPIIAMVMLEAEIWAGIVPEIIPDYLGGSIFPPL